MDPAKIPRGTHLHPRVAKLVRDYRNGINQANGEQRSDAWLAARQNALTSSDVAAVLGVNPWATGLSVLQKKINPAHRFKGNAATRHGVINEDRALKLYEAREGRKVIAFGLIFHPWKTYKWLGGSPDGITTDGRLLEIKCPYRRDIGDGEVPDYYIPQIQVMMAVTGLPVCDFVQYVPASPPCFPDPIYTCVQVPRSNDWFKAKVPIMRNFWNTVVWCRKTHAALERTRAMVATAATAEMLSNNTQGDALTKLWIDTRNDRDNETDRQALVRIRRDIAEAAQRRPSPSSGCSRLWSRITAADRLADQTDPKLIARRNRKRKRTTLVDWSSTCML